MKKEIYDKTIPLLIKRIVEEYPELPAQFVKNAQKDFVPISYTAMYNECLTVGAALKSLGCERGSKVGLIADNRKEWLYSSVGIMAIGAADVPRGCDTTAQDLKYLLGMPACSIVIVENKQQVKKILEEESQLPSLKTIISFDPVDFETLCSESKIATNRFDFISFEDFIQIGKEYRSAHPQEIEAEVEKGAREDIATIIFTSGTTGEPKGVMLTHQNFLAQLPDLLQRIPVAPGRRALSVLPVWHSFERLCEYVTIAGASSIIYSKPVGSVLLADIAKTNPHIFPSVPRIWESVYDAIQKTMRKTGGISYALFRFFSAVSISWHRAARTVTGQRPFANNLSRVLSPLPALIPTILLWIPYKIGDAIIFKKIRQKLGKNFLAGISGGGALPPNIDEFFWSANVCLLEGYGLTETAPVVAVRHVERPVFGTIGKALDCDEIIICDDKGTELPPNKLGSVMIRGANVMKGYYERPELTAKAINADGWFDSGDIGFKTITGEIILRGRKKDTIVLRGGENIEPAAIEMKLQESRFISQAVLVGQNERVLGALIVPDTTSVESWAKENNVENTSYTDILQRPELKKLFTQEINELICAQNGFRLFERISKFTLLEHEFEIGKELSAKQEVKRHAIAEIYKKEITAMFE